MNDDRVKILRMVEAGKVNVEDAARLIAALEDEQGEEDAPIAKVSPASPQPVPVATPVYETRPLGLGRSFLSAFASSLEGVISDGAQTDGARMIFCSLEDTNLTDAMLEGSLVVASSLEHANFEGANLRGARIICSDLEHADFRGANLEGATILCASLSHGDFRGVDLRGKRIMFASLSGINPRNRMVDLAVKK